MGKSGVDPDHACTALMALAGYFWREAVLGFSAVSPSAAVIFWMEAADQARKRCFAVVRSKLSYLCTSLFFFILVLVFLRDKLIAVESMTTGIDRFAVVRSKFVLPMYQFTLCYRVLIFCAKNSP